MFGMFEGDISDIDAILAVGRANDATGETSWALSEWSFWGAIIISPKPEADKVVM
jgi:hypothetical protein